MDANLSFPAVSPAPALSAASGATPDASAAALAGPLSGGDFANVLGSLMGRSVRQELAAAGLAEVGLKALPLGPQIQVITAAEPLPDAASLAAFARSQGLDESTVTALFGTAGSAAFGQITAPGVAGLAPLAGVPGANAGETATAVTTTAAELALNAALPGLMNAQRSQALQADTADIPLAQVQLQMQTQAVPAGFLSAASLMAFGQRSGQSAQDLTGTGKQAGEDGQLGADGAGLGNLAGLASAMVPGAMPNQPATPLIQPLINGAATTVAAAMTGTTSTAAPGAMAQAAAPALLEVLNAAPGVSQMAWQVSSAPQAQAADPLNQVSAASALGEAALSPTMQEAARLRLEPHEAVTRRLAELSGTGQTTVWAAVAGSNNRVAPEVRLDLSEFANLVNEQADSPDAAPMEAPRPSASSGSLAEAGRAPVAQAATGPAAPVPSQQAERLAHYEQLAERLGQALAQRLQSQIERGEWKVQMRLDPGQLGRIQLELDMHAGGLDAVFRSDNQVTRDLITQGMNKLRDSLAQSGTAVANVWVQSDSQRQSGGNPTPWQNPQGGQAEEPTPVVASTASASASAADGLDLMA